MGTFRIAKTFTFHAGHRLAKHPELCRFPHGHSYRVDVVVRAERLDERDMVCDYSELNDVVRAVLAPLDHAMILAAGDPHAGAFAPFAERVVSIPEGDPTAEVLARHLFRALAASLEGRHGSRVALERVRLWETPTAWAEYAEEQGTGG